jgi:hypothetical protein
MWQCRGEVGDAALDSLLERAMSELLQRSFRGTILERRREFFHRSANLWGKQDSQLHLKDLSMFVSPSSFIFLKTLTTSPLSNVSSSGSSA